MSVLDGLTNDISVEYEEALSKNERIIKQYWPKLMENLKHNDAISAKDLHKFDMAINGKKKRKDAPILDRFIELINILETLLPNSINKNFAKKCVYTRHKLTHPESKYKMVFSAAEYPNALLKLEQILCSHMLKSIGAEDVLIKKTLRLNANEPITL